MVPGDSAHCSASSRGDMDPTLLGQEPSDDAALRMSRNAVKVSVIMGFVNLFFVLLNLALLLTEVGSVSGIDRKLKAMERELHTIKGQIAEARGDA